MSEQPGKAAPPPADYTGQRVREPEADPVWERCRAAFSAAARAGLGGDPYIELVEAITALRARDLRARADAHDALGLMREAARLLGCDDLSEDGDNLVARAECVRQLASTRRVRGR